MRAEDVHTVVVVGAGTMGAGIAGEVARIGCRVRLVDVADAVLERGLQRLETGLQALVAAGVLTAAEAAAARSRVHASQTLEAACAGADLVVEAASEDLALKESVSAGLSTCFLIRENWKFSRR